VEIFHLLFLRPLAAGAHKAHLIVKGGCNLRFFFGSIRYSEDLDLDVSIVARETLRKNVNQVLTSAGLLRPLAAYGLSVETISAPKQTDTTQRWKVTLRAAGRTLPLNTKIEFSRRGAVEGARLEAVGTALAHGYRMTPPLVCHYGAEAAIVQKIGALAGRAEAQARDVFDLSLLLAAVQGRVPSAPDPKVAAKAAGRALEISYDEYVAQVLAYLTPEEAEPHKSPEAWEAQQLQVSEALARVSK
jgi:predicted nucleotidyltransferase component of viral defense system